MNTVDVIFVAGAFRSGSTLLSRLLGQVPGYVAVGECGLLWTAQAANELCSCGEPLRACPLWSSVVQEAFGGWEGIDTKTSRAVTAAQRHRNLPRLASDRWSGAATRRAVWAVTQLYKAIATVTGQSTIVDSTKTLPYLMLLERSSVINPSVVHLVRDPRGVASSWTRRVHRPEVIGREAYLRRFSPAGAAWSWLWMNSLIELHDRAKGQHVRIRYEDFVARPAQELLRVLEMVPTVTQPPPVLEQLRSGAAWLDAGHTVAGNPMRFNSGWVQLRPDRSWMNDLGTRQARIVSAVGWPLMRTYGYGSPGARL